MKLWNPQAENLSRAELRTIQFEKLKTLVTRVETLSPYYRDKFKRAGVSAASLKSLDQLSRLSVFLIRTKSV